MFVPVMSRGAEWRDGRALGGLDWPNGCGSWVSRRVAGKMVLSSEEAGEMRRGKERRRHGWVRRRGGGEGGATGGGGAVGQRGTASVSQQG